MLEPRPDLSPLGVKFKISDEHPRHFYMGVPPGNFPNFLAPQFNAIQMPGTG